jgi:hypothetical protein
MYLRTNFLDFIAFKGINSKRKLLTMQLHSGADHFGNEMNRGIMKRGCS